MRGRARRISTALRDAESGTTSTLEARELLPVVEHVRDTLPHG